MEDGIHDFGKIQVLFKGTEIFLLFLKGVSEISLTRGRIKSCTYEVLTLYTKERLCCCLLCNKFVHPHSLYMFSNDTALFNSVTRWAASFWIFCNVCES